MPDSKVASTNSFDKFKKIFDAAKTLEEKKRICREAALDPNFAPCLPASMACENMVKHDNKGKGVVWEDVDDSLLHEHVVDGVLSVDFNEGLIDAQIEEGLTEIYLFTSMSLTSDITEEGTLKENRVTRLDLIAYLAFRGIAVKGVVAQADAAPGQTIGSFYSDYYTVVTATAKGDTSRVKDVVAQSKNRIRESNDERDEYFGGDRNYAESFGHKTMMTKKVLEANPAIKKIYFIDDSKANQRGASRIVMDQQSDVLLCNLQLRKGEDQGAKHYVKAIKAYDKGLFESKDKYSKRVMTNRLLETLLEILNNYEQSGPVYRAEHKEFYELVKSEKAKITDNWKKKDAIENSLTAIYKKLVDSFEIYQTEKNQIVDNIETVLEPIERNAKYFSDFARMLEPWLKWHNLPYDENIGQKAAKWEKELAQKQKDQGERKRQRRLEEKQTRERKKQEQAELGILDLREEIKDEVSTASLPMADEYIKRIKAGKKIYFFDRDDTLNGNLDFTNQKKHFLENEDCMLPFIQHVDQEHVLFLASRGGRPGGPPEPFDLEVLSKIIDIGGNRQIYAPGMNTGYEYASKIMHQVKEHPYAQVTFKLGEFEFTMEANQFTEEAIRNNTNLLFTGKNFSILMQLSRLRCAPSKAMHQRIMSIPGLVKFNSPPTFHQLQDGQVVFCDDECRSVDNSRDGLGVTGIYADTQAALLMVKHELKNMAENSSRNDIVRWLRGMNAILERLAPYPALLGPTKELIAEIKEKQQQAKSPNQPLSQEVTDAWADKCNQILELFPTEANKHYAQKLYGHLEAADFANNPALSRSNDLVEDHPRGSLSMKDYMKRQADPNNPKALETAQAQADRIFKILCDDLNNNSKKKIGLVYSANNDQAMKIHAARNKGEPIPKIPGHYQAELFEALRQLINADEKYRSRIVILPIATSMRGGNNTRGNQVGKHHVDRDLAAVAKCIADGYDVHTIPTDKGFHAIGGKTSRNWGKDRGLQGFNGETQDTYTQTRLTRLSGIAMNPDPEQRRNLYVQFQTDYQESKKPENVLKHNIQQLHPISRIGKLFRHNPFKALAYMIKSYVGLVSDSDFPTADATIRELENDSRLELPEELKVPRAVEEVHEEGQERRVSRDPVVKPVVALSPTFLDRFNQRNELTGHMVVEMMQNQGAREQILQTPALLATKIFPPPGQVKWSSPSRQDNPVYRHHHFVADVLGKMKPKDRQTFLENNRNNEKLIDKLCEACCEDKAPVARRVIFGEVEAIKLEAKARPVQPSNVEIGHGPTANKPGGSKEPSIKPSSK